MIGVRTGGIAALALNGIIEREGDHWTGSLAGFTENAHLN